MEKQTKGICAGCKWAKDKQGAACYCVLYGYVVGYPKTKCRGCKREQVQEQKVDVGRANV